MRKCVGCCKMFDKRQLIRLAKDEDGCVFIDERGKFQARGAYLCRNAECLKKAEKSKAFQRAFSCAVCSELYEKLKIEVSEGVSE